MIVSVLVMELCLTSLLLGWLWVAATGSPWPAPVIALLPGVGGLVAGRVIPYSWRRLNWFDYAWWGAVSVLVALLAEVANVTAPGRESAGRWNLLFAVGLLLAWRGWVLAEGWLDREMVETELQAGMVAIAILASILAWQVPGAGIVPVIIFFAAGLIGLGIARRAERRAPGAPAESDWLVLAGIMVALLLILTIGILLLVTPDLVTSVAQGGLAVIATGVRGLAAVIAWLGSFLPQAEGPTTSLPPAGGPGPIPPTISGNQTQIPAPPIWVFEMLFTLIGTLVLYFGLRALLRLRTRARLWYPKKREDEPGPPVSDAPPFSWAGWWSALLRWFGGWLSGSRQRSTERAGQTGLRAAAAPAEQRSIRALYRDLLTAAERAGFDRSPSTTPAELAGTMSRARPVVREPIRAITDLYVRTRYGEETAGRDSVNRMRAAVQQVREELTRSGRDDESPMAGGLNRSDRAETRPTAH